MLQKRKAVRNGRTAEYSDFERGEEGFARLNGGADARRGRAAGNVAQIHAGLHRTGGEDVILEQLREFLEIAKRQIEDGLAFLDAVPRRSRW